MVVGFFRSFFRGAAEEDCKDYHNYLLQALGEFLDDRGRIPANPHRIGDESV